MSMLLISPLSITGEDQSPAGRADAPSDGALRLRCEASIGGAGCSVSFRYAFLSLVFLLREAEIFDLDEFGQ
jgi:hypothetical protein